MKKEYSIADYLEHCERSKRRLQEQKQASASLQVEKLSQSLPVSPNSNEHANYYCMSKNNKIAYREQKLNKKLTNYVR